eukprot:CAMPEP_0206240352 /NCGR_PEP_ID=MMETSP0047_2-20121206/15893_1 /ASSEMBLY_ACC=CAM_ASM_000192 /TAXON_ID=195065 /ORGANISM="Chroomonas mesostigmatica_cf, Strain CCMP1168" /LENGTH=435 /DNA_ID=CAMNT_0053665129 /DNA_START=110 /DNA_END=1414 /DNA_ORIENTATION=-
MDTTLLRLLDGARVPMDQIESDYPYQTGCVRELIGLVPDCDAYLEIWPAAFRSYNLIVPNCFNVPFSPIGWGPGGALAQELQGAAMFAVSKAAECPYCTAHTCSWALRRGTSPETLEAGWRAQGGAVGEAERATFAVAKSMGRVPPRLTAEERGALIAAVGEPTAEVLMFSMCGMGYLNKVMDSLGVQLEQACFDDVRDYVGGDMDVAASRVGANLDTTAPTTRPPTDSWFSNLRFLLKVPGALWAERRIVAGVPGTWPEVGEHLSAKTGHSFPFLAALPDSFHGRRVVTAVAVVLSDNYNLEASSASVPTKVLAGVLFAVVARNDALEEQFERLAVAFSVGRNAMRAARELASLEPAGLGGDVSKLPKALRSLDRPSQHLLLLAHALATTPVHVTPELVGALRRTHVPPQSIVELVNHMAITQLQLRIITLWPL